MDVVSLKNFSNEAKSLKRKGMRRDVMKYWVILRRKKN